MLTVNVHELKAVSFKIIKQIERQYFSVLDPLEDFYWMISFRQEAEIEYQPGVNLGSLVDDWESMLPVLKKESPPSTLDVSRVGSILLMIAAGKFKEFDEQNFVGKRPISMSLATVQEIIERLFVKAEQSGFGSVTLSYDYYWAIEKSELYETWGQKPVPVIRSVHDDWQRVQAYVYDELIFTSEGIEALAYVFKALGYTLLTLGAEAYFDEGVDEA